MSSRFGSNDWPVYGVAHRRGGAVHTFICTHGTTKRGRDQRHKDDVCEDGAAAPPRKCPKVLNDWTKCQPHTDKHNRWRQSILAIEERFRTTSFPFRLFTTLIVGCSAVSTFTGHTFHVKNEQLSDPTSDDDFRESMETLAVDLMTNNWDEEHPADGISPAARTSVARSSSPSMVTFSRSSGLAAGVEAHIPVSIKQAQSIAGFHGGNVQRCGECRSRLTSFCCGHPDCLSANSIVPLCLPEVKSKGKTVLHSCLSRHKMNPSQSHASAASAGRKKAAGSLRRRPGR